MEKELSHSLNIVLSSDVVDRLRTVQTKIAGAIKEQRNYDTSPHLSVANKFMGQSETNTFIAALTKGFKNDTAFELEFADFTASETGNYIFLNLGEASRQLLFAMHERAFTASQGIGNEGQSGTPPKYPYDPHISIIKLLPEESAKALGLIVHDLSGVKMLVQTLEVTRQEETGNNFSTFPVVAEIKLN